jgi:predicted RNA-binding protein with PIN domain
LTSYASGEDIQIVDTQVITTIVSTGGAVIVGLGGMWITAQQLGKRMDDLRDGLSKRMDDFSHRLDSLEAKVDILMQKFYELDNRLSHLEDR